MGAIDPRGRVLLYSSHYNSVFSYSEVSQIDKFIDLNRLVNTRGCIKDMDVNEKVPQILSVSLGSNETTLL